MTDSTREKDRPHSRFEAGRVNVDQVSTHSNEGDATARLVGYWSFVFCAPGAAEGHSNDHVYSHRERG